MRSKLLTVALLSSALASCTTTGPAGPGPYLRVEDYYHGWNFVGARMTPDTDISLRIYNAPVPCGRSFCPSGSWDPIGVIRSGPVGGVWPNIAGQFGKVMNRDEMTARRGVTVTCYPGEWWYVNFSATDTATNRTTADYQRATTAGFFYDLPRCPSP